MRIINSLVEGARTVLDGGRVDSVFDIVPGIGLDQLGMYDLLEALYYNDVQDVADTLRPTGQRPYEARGLRNPSHAVVEYFVSTVWPRNLNDAFPFEYPPEFTLEHIKRLERNVHKLWLNSNWAVKKSLYIRRQAMLGDAVIKIATNQKSANDKPTRVFFRHIHPMYVTEFDVDERDYLTYIRIDVPKSRRTATGKVEQFTEVEVWDKERGRFRVWHTDLGFAAPYEALGPPRIDDDMEAYGVDFIPFVHAKFKDDGRRRGLSALTPAVSKILEADRMATRMSDMLFRFNRPEKALVSNHLDPRGFPMPAPKLPEPDEFDEVTMGNERWYRFPSGWSPQNLVAAVDYRSLLDAINAQVESNRLTDFPSLTYYMLAEIGRDLSGKALRYMLTPAISQTVEARANSDWTLVRANQMGIHVMKQNGLLEDGADVGSYDQGDYEHWFGDRPVISLSEDEQVSIRKTKAEASAARRAYGVTMRQLLLEDGFTEAEAEEMLTQMPAEQVAGELLEPADAQPADAEALFRAAMTRG